MIESFNTLINEGDFTVLRVYLFGEVKFVDLLVVLMLCDIATGIMKAFKNKRLRSRTALYGYFRKIGTFIILIVANVIDQVFALNGAVAVGTVGYFILNEIVSIVENLAQLGLNVPSVITERLHVSQEEKKKEEEK